MEQPAVGNDRNKHSADSIMELGQFTKNVFEHMIYFIMICM